MASLRAAVTTKPPVKGMTRGKVKGRKRRETFDTAGTEAERVAELTKTAQEPDWGLFEPLRGVFGPILSLVSPLLSTNLVIAVLSLLLAQAWFFGPRAGAGVGFPLTGQARFVAYEAMWQNEESELWNWLEDRVGLDQVVQGPLWQLREDAKQRQKVMAKIRMSKRVADQGIEDRQVDNAIRVTEERLGALKQAVDRKRGTKRDP